MAGILSKLTAPLRRLFTGRPTSLTPESHLAWVHEQMQRYVTTQYYTSPLSNDLNLTGETREMRDAYRKFAFKEPAVKAPRLKKVLSVASLDATVTPANNSGELGQRIASFVDHAIGTSAGGWPGLLFNTMTMALVDGFSLCEKKLTVYQRGEWRGFWGLDELRPKDTRDITFTLDVYRNVVGIRNMIAGQGGVIFQPADFVVFTHLPIFSNPFGISDLRAANRAANLIEALIKLRSMLLENYSGPFLSYKKGNVGSMEEAKATLARARANGFVIINPEDELEVMNLATSSPAQFEDAIADLRKEAATAIGGSYLHLYESKTDQGDSETHKSVSELFEWWLATSVCQALNSQLVGDLVYPNFGHNVDLPTISLGAVNYVEVMKVLEMVEKAQAVGMEVSQEHVRELVPLEAPRHAGDVLKKPTPAALPGAGGDDEDKLPKPLPAKKPPEPKKQVAA